MYKKRSIHIVILSIDNTLMNFLSTHLKRNADKVSRASSLKILLKALEQGLSPDIIIVDEKLVDLQKYAEAIFLNDHYKRLYSVALINNIQKETIEKVYRLMYSDFITNSFSDLELFAKIDNYKRHTFGAFTNMEKIKELSLAIEEKSQKKKELQKKLDKMRVKAHTDFLTKCKNFNYLLDYKNDSTKKRSGIFLNIIDFSQFNYNNGFRTGNDMLINLAQMIMNLYNNKFQSVIRVENDKFLLLFNVSNEENYAIAQKIQQLFYSQYKIRVNIIYFYYKKTSVQQIPFLLKNEFASIKKKNIFQMKKILE